MRPMAKNDNKSTMRNKSPDGIACMVLVQVALLSLLMMKDTSRRHRGHRHCSRSLWEGDSSKF